MNSLYDVFNAIREDERDHVSTMQKCLDENVAVKSVSTEKAIVVGTAATSAAAYLLSTGNAEIMGLEKLNQILTSSEALESSASASVPLLEQVGGLLNYILKQYGRSLNGISEDALSPDLVEAGQSVFNEAPSLLEQFGAVLGPMVEEFGHSLLVLLRELVFFI